MALIMWVPTASPLIDNAALPLLTFAAPSEVVPSRNATSPGALAADTLAVSFSGVPAFTGSASVFSVTVVDCGALRNGDWKRYTAAPVENASPFVPHRSRPSMGIPRLGYPRELPVT